MGHMCLCAMMIIVDIEKVELSSAAAAAAMWKGEPGVHEIKYNYIYNL